MTREDSKNDVFLKRLQLIIAILAGLATLTIGLYNCKNIFFPEKNLSSIEVKILSVDNRQPIPAAAAALYNSNNVLISTAFADGSGVFSKTEIPSGGCMLKISAVGYEPEVVTLALEPGKKTSLDVALKSIPKPVVTQPALASGDAYTQQQTSTTFQKPSAIQNAIEEVGSSWIKKLAAKEFSKESESEVAGKSTAS